MRKSLIPPLRMNSTSIASLKKPTVKMACEIAVPGDVILLSPACASYDQWKNFEERGDAFIAMVNNLKG